MKRWLGVVCFVLSFWSTEAQDPGRYDVVLHEIFADPTPSRGLPASEFIEIRNRSGNSINLKNWSVKTGFSIGKIAVNYVLAPDSMVILCSSSAAASFQSFGQTLILSSFPSLNNDGDSLLLISASGKIIHGLVWNTSWYQNELKEEGGWSLEMKDINLPCETIYNWSASIDPKGGTPGKLNSIREKLVPPPLPTFLYSYIKGKQDLFLQFSKPIDASIASLLLSPTLNINKTEEVPPLYSSVLIRLQQEADSSTIYKITASGFKTCSGTPIPAATIRSATLQRPQSNKIVINEVLFNPPTGGSDFVELLNRGTQTIDAQTLYLANRNTAGAIASITNISNTSFPIFPGDHIVISADPNWIKQRYLSPDSTLIIRSTLPSYPDDKGTVVLIDDQGKILDELNYDEKWHFTLISNNEGISLERINPQAATQQSSNWHSASGTSGYATPAYRNSQVNNQEQAKSYFSLNKKLISPDNDGQDDYLMIQYSFPTAGYVTTLRIYDASGREIIKLANNILCGTTGQFRWDGTNATGTPLRKGFYVLYAEAYHTSGNVIKFKESVAVYGN